MIRFHLMFVFLTVIAKFDCQFFLASRRANGLGKAGNCTTMNTVPHV